MAVKASLKQKSPPEGGKLTDSKIRELLDSDHANGGIPASRNGKINRAYYATKLGYTPGALTKFRHVFAEYEQKLGVETGPMRHFSEMRDWLYEEYDAGRLGLRNGKVDRTAAYQRFGLKGGGTFVRYPEIRALFEDLDARAQAEGYLPNSTKQDLDRLKKALANHPALNKDRKTINLVALARTINLPKAFLLRQPFAEVIAEHQTMILEKVSASRIDPFVHGRVYAFSDLAPSWPTLFLERVGVRFKQFAPSVAPGTLKSLYLKLFGLLTWIGNSSQPSCKAVMMEAFAMGRISSADEWEDTLLSYRDWLIAEGSEARRSANSINGALKALRNILSALASGGLIPEIPTRLTGIKHAMRRSGRLKSVAEATTSNATQKANDYVAFAEERLQELSKANGFDLGQTGAEAFCESLRREFRYSRNHPIDTADAVRLVLEKRLNSLQESAAAIVGDAMASYERGRELLEKADIDVPAFEAAYLDKSLNSYERSKLVRSCFPNPKSADQSEVGRGIANLIRLIRECYDGDLPSIQATTAGPYGAFFAKRLLEYGGLAKIAPMLSPGRDTIGAILTLYLIESGANVAVGRNLRGDCLKPSDQVGYRRITGSKTRARGRPIVVDLPESSRSVRAIEWLVSIVGAQQSDEVTSAKRLFKMRIGSRFQLVTEHWYTNWFKKFAADVPGLEDILLVPSMIRPSVLLHTALSNDGRLMVGIAQGQHGLQVSQGYQQKWPTRLKYDENIRKFQNAFETLIMSGTEDAAAKLGLSIEQFKKRLGDLRATGLGTFCKDGFNRSGDAKSSCSTLDCWNNCPHLLIIAEVEAIAALQLWQASLRAVQGEWERDQPERWEEVWLPWLCLTDVVEEKMVRGPMIKVWKLARKRASEISAQTGYSPPRPW